MKEKVNDALKVHFRPEFLNRIDDTIVFHALSKEDITSIVRMMINRINTQLGEKSIQIEPTEAALDLLADENVRKKLAETGAISKVEAQGANGKWHYEHADGGDKRGQGGDDGLRLRERAGAARGDRLLSRR